MSPSRAATLRKQVEQDRLGHLAREHGERAFREHDEATPARPHELRVEIERLLAEIGIELDVLQHVALNERYRDRRACRRRPCEEADDESLDAERDRHREPPQGSPQRRPRKRVDREGKGGGDERDRERDREHAADRSVACERASRMLAVSERQPAESGEQHAAQPFHRRPCARRGDRALPRARCRPAGAKPARGGGEEGEIGAEARSRDAGQRQRHTAESIERDVDPRHAGAEKSEAEREPQPGGDSRHRGVLPQQDDEREHHDGDERGAERREPEHRHDAGEERELRAQRGQAAHRAAVAPMPRRNAQASPINGPPASTSARPAPVARRAPPARLASV